MRKVTKDMLNKNINVVEGNTVLKDTDQIGFLIFSLIARDNCPYATNLCKSICYGRNAQELFPLVYNSRYRNYVETLKPTFERDMINIIKYHLGRKKYQGKKIFFRWHETGDFYSQNYLNKVMRICNAFKGNKRIVFQAYTKSLPYLINKDIKKNNIKLIYSIMADTKKEDIEKAKELGLYTFTAIPEEEYKNIPYNHRCKGVCGDKCKVCYTGHKDMYVLYHGVRAPKRKAKIKLNNTLYWRKNYSKNKKVV